MKLPDKLKPQLVCSKDLYRRLLRNACVRDGLVFASNGRMAIAAIIDPEDIWKEDVQQEALIPPEALKLITLKRTKGNILCKDAFSITGPEEIRVRRNLDETTTFRTLDEVSNYPKVITAFPEESERSHTLHVNAKMLLDVANALGDDVVSIKMDLVRPLNPLVIGTTRTDRVGLLMPIDPGRSKFPETNTALRRIEKLKKQSKT